MKLTLQNLCKDNAFSENSKRRGCFFFCQKKQGGEWFLYLYIIIYVYIGSVLFPGWKSTKRSGLRLAGYSLPPLRCSRRQLGSSRASDSDALCRYALVVRFTPASRCHGKRAQRAVEMNAPPPLPNSAPTRFRTACTGER